MNPPGGGPKDTVQAVSPEEMTVTLEHRFTHERRTLPVLHAEASWKLYVRWGLAGLYLFDTRKGALLLGRRELPWADAEAPKARLLWYRLRHPGELWPADLLAYLNTQPNHQKSA